MLVNINKYSNLRGRDLSTHGFSHLVKVRLSSLGIEKQDTMGNFLQYRNILFDRKTVGSQHLHLTSGAEGKNDDREFLMKRELMKMSFDMCTYMQK